MDTLQVQQHDAPPTLSDDRSLYIKGRAILSLIPEYCTLVNDPLQGGAFISMQGTDVGCRLVFSLGRIAKMERFACCHRYEPFWMRPAIGTSTSELPVETQFLLIKRRDGLCVLILPILDGAFRSSLEGAESDELMLIAESGDPAVVASGLTGVFIAVGKNPYVLMKTAARSVMARMQTGRLREEKSTPDFLDLFGWCTWDAFNHEVSHDKVCEGLQSFIDGGVAPKYMILDDGWQSVRDITTGGKWLTSFEGSEKFPQGIVPTIHAAKEQYGLKYFFAWHPIQGYFGGVDGNAFPQYRIRNVAHQYGLGIKHYNPNVDRAFGHVVGFVEPASINQFLQDYHRHLRLQGVDGIKADSQAFLESMGAGYGGRVDMMQCYHDALEGSVNTHFLGRLINCMSCSTDMLYTALSSSVTRTSGDFMPAYNAAHQGLHIYKNALASFFAGEFIQPDWDMFQSNHPTAVLHAVARAISGGPVYVSDKPDGHDFAILQKLVLSDGSIPRAHGVGRPTADCLFYDPTQENVLLKIFNVNEQAGVVGVFNVRDDNDGAIHGYIRGTVSPQDIDGLAGKMFAVYRHTSKELTTIPFDGTVNISLTNFSCDVITIVPIIDGIAPIGLTEKYNSGGTIIRKGVDPRGGYSVDLRDGGEFLAWRVEPPTSVFIDENTADFDYDVDTGALRVQIAEMGQHTIRILD